MEILKFVLILFSVLAFVSLLVCCVGNAWFEADDGITGGLWKICKNDICERITLVHTWIETARAGIIISCLACGVGGFFAMSLAISDRKRFLPISVFMLVSAVSALIGLCVFLNSTKDGFDDYTNVKHKWSFILGWLGVGFLVISCVIATVTDRC